jgi:hypothetical protein
LSPRVGRAGVSPAGRREYPPVGKAGGSPSEKIFASFNNHGHLSGARSSNMDFVKDLWGFLKVRKKFWLLPIILTLLFFGALMIFASGSAIAPFIYTIF